MNEQTDRRTLPLHNAPLMSGGLIVDRCIVSSTHLCVTL